jgi:hypothetical protein
LHPQLIAPAIPHLLKRHFSTMSTLSTLLRQPSQIFSYVFTGFDAIKMTLVCGALIAGTGVFAREGVEVGKESVFTKLGSDSSLLVVKIPVVLDQLPREHHYKQVISIRAAGNQESSTNLNSAVNRYWIHPQEKAFSMRSNA